MLDLRGNYITSILKTWLALREMSSRANIILQQKVQLSPDGVKLYNATFICEIKALATMIYQKHFVAILLSNIINVFSECNNNSFIILDEHVIYYTQMILIFFNIFYPHMVLLCLNF